jgi:transposase
MLRITLTPAQHEALRALRGEAALAPAERDRVEMLALCAAGWTVPAIAAHLGYCAETVRRLFRRFPGSGLAVVRHRRPGPGPDLPRRERVEAALRALLAEGRTWTAPQLAEALGEYDLHLSARQTRRYLRVLEAGWRRTKRTLAHKQDRESVARASGELALLGNGRRRAS